MNCLILSLLTLFIYFAVTSAAAVHKDPLECQITVDRSQGFNFCQFVNEKSDEKDVTKIDAKTTMFQGQIIKSKQVSAIAFAQSDLDQIPSAIFTTFHKIQRIKYDGGDLKTIAKESFQGAESLKYLELNEVNIDSIKPQAFENAPELLEITFKKCQIGKIAYDAFDGLTKLHKINFKGSTYPKNDFVKKLPKSVQKITLA